MAYPTVSAPYGFKPINRVDGMPYAGATRSYAIDSAASIFNGDLVIIDAGVIKPFTGTTAGFPVGVFTGCSYTNTLSQTIYGQYYPAGAANGIAKVVVDDQAAYQVAVTSSGDTVVSTLTIAVIGNNIAVQQGTGGNTTTGNSSMSVDAGTEDTTSTLPIRIIDVVPATATSTGYPELVVKINVSQFQNATGVV
tara:strand:- start:39 stop:620 length:582 start_codon:yes stop_codon:yes gene_type:complete